MPGRVEELKVHGSHGEQATLGNAKVADCRWFRQGSRGAEVGSVQHGVAGLHQPDVRGHQMERLAVGHLPGEGEASGAEQRARYGTQRPEHAVMGEEPAGQSLR